MLSTDASRSMWWTPVLASRSTNERESSSSSTRSMTRIARPKAVLALALLLPSRLSRCTAAASGWTRRWAKARPSRSSYPCAPKDNRMTKRILVVEDQDDLRGILRDLFTRSGYIVIEAADGATGVASAKSNCPDIILMDIQMPVIDGYEATRRIKADPTLTKIPVVAVSSCAMKGDEEKARAAGCDHYVTKPYSPIQLLRMIRGYLGDK